MASIIFKKLILKKVCLLVAVFMEIVLNILEPFGQILGSISYGPINFYVKVSECVPIFFSCGWVLLNQKGVIDRDEIFMSSRKRGTK
jgi:hypothetical protein